MRISGMEATTNSIQQTSDMQGRSTGYVPVSPELPTRNADNHIANENDYPINEKVVSEAVERVNKAIEGSNRRFEYSVHEKTNEIMIKVIDETTKEVIREIPPKKILDMVANMLEMAGLLVDERR
jgi:flagellar protein FlaG